MIVVVMVVMVAWCKLYLCSSERLCLKGWRRIHRRLDCLAWNLEADATCYWRAACLFCSRWAHTTIKSLSSFICNLTTANQVVDVIYLLNQPRKGKVSLSFYLVKTRGRLTIFRGFQLYWNSILTLDI